MSSWAVTPRGKYPANWQEIARAVKDAAGWRCVRCAKPHTRVGWHILTVHHLDGDKSNCRWWNLVALCQRCHLHIQGKLDPNRPWMFDHTTWFQPYVSGFYAAKYLGQPDLTQEEVVARLDELLALERQAVFE